MASTNYMTNDELLRELRDRKELTDTELTLIDRLTTALDEIDALTSELKVQD